MYVYADRAHLTGDFVKCYLGERIRNSLYIAIEIQFLYLKLFARPETILCVTVWVVS